MGDLARGLTDIMATNGRLANEAPQALRVIDPDGRSRSPDRGRRARALSISCPRAALCSATSRSTEKVLVWIANHHTSSARAAEERMVSYP